MADFLTENEAKNLVTEYMAKEQPARSTQALVRDSAVSYLLSNFMVKPGKVSDSIHGGHGSFTVDEATWKKEFEPFAWHALAFTVSNPFTVVEKGKNISKVRVDYNNPPLSTPDGVPLRIMVRTDRISTHDINRGQIPFKDQILAVNHHMMRDLTKEILGTSQFDIEGMPQTSVVIAAENLKTIPIEFVLRAYMAKTDTSTSLYMAWMQQKDKLRSFCGHSLDGKSLFTNCRLPYVLDTPSTKSDAHDQSMSADEIIAAGLCTRAQYQQIRNAGLVAFGVASRVLAERGLILADTKTEHGVNKQGQIVSQDELYTMDSSRFWKIKDYQNQLEMLLRGDITVMELQSVSKQYAREFSKGSDPYTDEQRQLIAVRYIQGIQDLTGQPFRPDVRSREERVLSGLQAIVDRL